MLKFIRRVILTLIIIAILVVGAFALIGYVGYKDVVDKVSIEEKVNQLRSQDTYVTLDEISQPMQDAVVAIEDHRFYDHGGIDYYALMRSVVVNLSGTGNQGGSTLTQQLAKNFYFMEDNTSLRKISEAYVAKALEENYSKDEILEMYVNIVYYGDNHYGIYEASTGYYDVLPSELNLAQASVLAGLPQAPSVYALSNHNPQTQERQRMVLKAMLDYKYINQSEYEAVINSI